MSIQDKRAEILRLIKRVNRVSHTADRDAPPAPARPPHSALEGATPLQLGREARTDRSRTRHGHLDERRQQLAEITQRRDELEASLAGRDVVDRVDGLEKRLETMEELLRNGLPAAAAAPAPALPAPASPYPPDSTLAGILQDGLLSDLLQLVASNVMSGDFCVFNEATKVHLYFDEGNIRHAVSADITGEGAVFAAMALEGGSYFFRETTDLPADVTVQGNTQFLILEALRQVDEKRAGPQDG